jgi:hypothetical protein
LSGSSPLTCLAWEALPVAYATASIALGIMWPHKPHHYVKVGIPSGGDCTYSFWYLSNYAAICCYHCWDGTHLLPAMIAADSSKVWQIPEALCTVWAPDDGRRNRLKHVERFIEINKLRNVVSCWLHFGNILKMHGLMNIKLLA